MVLRAWIVIGVLSFARPQATSADVATAREVEVDGAPAGEVVVNGKPVLRIRAADENLSPFARAKIVAGRINQLLREGIVPEQITYREVRGEAAVMIQDTVIATVDRVTAAREGTEAQTLAEKWRGALVAALLSLEKPVAAAGHERPPAPPAPATQRIVADNGMVFLLHRLPRAGRVAVRVAVRAGSLHEGARLGYGLGYVVSQTVPLGTRRRSREQLQAELNRLGAKLVVEPRAETVSYQVVVPPEFAGQAVALLADLVQNATFPPQALAKAWPELSKRSSTRGALRDLLEAALLETMFRRHPVRYPVRGRPEFRMLLQREELLDYYNRLYVPENTVCAVAGEFDSAAVLSRLQQTFGPWTYRPAPAPALPLEPPQRAARRRTIVAPLAEEGGIVGWRTVPLWSVDAPAFRVLAAVLGSGDASRLHSVTAPGGGPAQSLTVESFTPGFDAGRFVVRWTAPAERADAVLAAVRREVTGLQTQPVSETEREAASAYLEAAWRRRQEDPATVCAQIVAGEVAAGAPDLTAAQVAAATKLTPADLQAAAARYLKWSNATVVLVRRQP